MYILGQCFGHLAASNIGNSMQCQTVIDLVILVQVLTDRVYYQSKEVRVLVHQKSYCQIALRRPVSTSVYGDSKSSQFAFRYTLS